MKTQNLLRPFIIVVSLVIILTSGSSHALAAPPAPTLLSPTNGSTIIEPVLEWQAVTGAAYYKVELSTSPTFITLDHTYTTYNTSITPSSAIEHATFYWRVSSVDAGDQVGTPSPSWSFVKNIPAPTLLSPSNLSSIIEPVLEWQAVADAAYYKVELSTVPTFVTLDHTYTTYNTRIVPSSSIEHATFYWRVSGVDAQDHVGAPSASWSFTKNIPAPTLLSPVDLSTIIEPVLEWQAVAGAAYYKVELSTVSNFNPVTHVYTTFNTRITPSNAIDHTTYYWRVSGVDAGDHVGTPSAGWSFVKNIPAPTLLSPANGGTISEPVLEWQAAEGAAYYKVELSTVSNFNPVAHVYTTYNTRITPTSAISNTTFYWRVSGVDAEDYLGTPSVARTFTLNSPPAPTDVIPQLLLPLDTSTILTDPSFSWTRMVGAAEYRVIVSKSNTYSPIYDSIVTDYASFTPYVGTPAAGNQDAYPNGTYYWKVEARNGSGTVIATSLGGSFTKQMTLPLPPAAPPDGTTLTTDPTFQWTRVVGAAYYRLKVSKDPSLSPLYDYVNADYVSFTPYIGTPTAGAQDIYPNGTYYWEVEARDHGGIVIATSLARSFTKQMALSLIAPTAGATLTADPTFQWTRVVGAAYYRLKVSKDPSLSPLYDYVNTDYVSFTPYIGTPTAGAQDVYPNGTYYWEVEARDHGGIVIATSSARSFTKKMTLTLIAPTDGARLTIDPTFQWTRVVGAAYYRLKVSKNPALSPLYDYVNADYVSFTPYIGTPTAGALHTYSNSIYYWEVEARDHGGIVIVTSNGWSFTKGLFMYLPIIFK
jgi:hypothetical protein